MKYDEDSAAAAVLLKQAVPHMVEKQIPANPVNYTLWYNYVAEYIPPLNKALDHIIGTFGTCSPEQSQELYVNYIISNHINNNHASLDNISKLAAHLINRLSETVEESDEFDKNLTENISQLEQSNSLEEVTALIDSVINSSKALSEANQHFRAEMQTAQQEIDSLQSELEQTQKDAFFDQLTQLYNRRAFDRQINQLLAKDDVAKDVYLILADLDHFKSFNDNYGHLIGDRVLQRMGAIIQDYCPDNSIGTRYGGEEFAIIVSNSTFDEAAAIAEELRRRLEMLRVKVKGSDQVLNNISASFGVGRYRLGEAKETFIHRTDQALYRAKNAGRNRVEIED